MRWRAPAQVAQMGPCPHARPCVGWRVCVRQNVPLEKILPHPMQTLRRNRCQTRTRPREKACVYGVRVSGATIFAYVGGNPLLFVDPEGLRSARPAAPGGNAYNRRQWRRHGPGSFERPTGEGTVCDHLGLLGRVELEHEIRWKAPRIAFDGLIQGLGGHAVEFGQVGMRASYVSYPGRLRRI